MSTTLFCYISPKSVLKPVPKRGLQCAPGTSYLQLATITFWILENRSLKVPVDRSTRAPLSIPSQESIIFRTEEEEEEEDEHLDFMCPRTEKALRAKMYFLLEKNIPLHEKNEDIFKVFLQNQ